MNIHTLPYLCTACGACVNKCPIKCITIHPNENGFNTPFVDQACCINCGACEKICPVINAKERTIFWKNGSYYAAYAIDSSIRNSGSSGGIFFLLAKETLNQGGVVFGAAYSSDNLQVAQRSTEEVSLDELCKSKYVESTSGYSFRRVRELLDVDRQVLFCGTSCQIDGLYAYLGKHYSNLLTCDFLCHGTPGAGIYKKYMEKLSAKYGQIEKVDFRSKAFGWKAYCLKVVFAGGRQYLQTKYIDPYVTMFFENTLVRDSCLECKRVSSSQADITLGDAWKVHSDKMPEDNKGISLVGIHTDVGRRFFEVIRNQCKCVLLETEQVRYAFEQSLPAPLQREEVLRRFRSGNDIFVIKKVPKTLIRGIMYRARAEIQRMRLKKAR